MTVQPISLDARRTRWQAGYLAVPKTALVDLCMDAQALTREFIYANGATIQALRFLPAGPERDQLLSSAVRAHDKAVAALGEWMSAANRFESQEPTR